MYYHNLIGCFFFPRGQLINIFRSLHGLHLMVKTCACKRGHCPSRLLILDEMDQLDSKAQHVLYTLFEWPFLPDSRLCLIGKVATASRGQR